MEDKLEIYLDIDMNDDFSGMDAMSFVDRPATRYGWNKFSNDSKYKFKLEEDKRIVTGVAMIAETPIERYSKEFGTYFVKFTEESILNMMKKYFKSGKIHNLNEQHSNKIIDDVYLIESFVTSDKIKSTLYPDIHTGSWITSYFVEDVNYWNETIKSDRFTGFSLEGTFIENYEMEMVQNTFNRIKEICTSNWSDNHKFQSLKKLLNSQRI